jgi:hypothetical protein
MTAPAARPSKYQAGQPTHPMFSKTWPAWVMVMVICACAWTVKGMVFPSHHAAAAAAAPAAPVVSTDYAGPVGAGRAGFARAVLSGSHLPATASNVDAFVIWEAAEGGGFGNQAANNPLNLNPSAAQASSWPGSQADGAWAFNTEAQGIDYTITYLATYSNYAGIRAAFASGHASVHSILVAIVTSPWASSHYVGNSYMQDELAATAALRTVPRSALTLAA